LKKFDFEHWWNLVAAAGAIIAVASITEKFVPGFPIGLGLLFFGVGESANHPRRTEIKGVTLGNIYKITGNPWKPKVFGLFLDAFGVGLFGLGLFQVAFAP